MFFFRFLCSAISDLALGILKILIRLCFCDVWWNGGREMKVFSTVFQDFGKNMVGKRYLQH